MGHAFRAVKIEFDNFIPAGSLGRDDCENQIRGAGQPFTVRLVADHQHVGTDDGVLRKFHVCCKHRLAVRAIVERFVKLPKYGGADLLMIEAGDGTMATGWPCISQAKSQSEDWLFALILLARPERFERPTPWFVAKYSIQLSYGRLAVLEREIIPSWFAPLKHYLDQASGRWRCRGLASGLCAAGADRDVPCGARPGLARRSQARLTTGRR